MKTCSLFILLLVFSIILIFGVPVLCMILILKPQMPDFSLKTVNVKSYKLDIISQNLFVSSFFSLNLIAENPNKVGLSFDSSRFHVLSQGLVVGFIRIPEFHQPPLSKNISIETRVLVKSVNVSEIMYKNSKKDDSLIKILGDVKAQVRIFRVTLPKFKIGLDCDINVNKSRFSISSEVYSMKWSHNHMISLPFNSQTVSKKCSVAIVL
ncbi:hypothetical protein CASFOL_025842 [Castilleja foliolosa]|uniref:Late embryogenesis abundant protein LEA-2 subgroup domain-containing protein n=1 Tax=Castilleja foliolosa TaxID=1961234 RepID=A0ABD3CSA1_9LAMI